MQYAVFITLTSPDICHVLPAFLHHLILRHSPLPWLPQSTKVVSATDGQTHVHKEGCLKMRHNQKRNSGSQLRDYFRGWTDTAFSLNWQPRYIRIIYSTNFPELKYYFWNGSTVIYHISRPIRCTVIFSLEILGGEKKNITSSVYDCTVEDVEYIYNKLSIHIFNSKRRRFHSNA